MKILIKQARIVDPSSSLNGQVTDILIEKGIIVETGRDLQADSAKIIEHKGLHVSPGWMDVFANFGDPGHEYRETLVSGSAAAEAGGYTDVMLVPNTNPVVQNKAGVEYLVQRAATLPVNIHPIGAVSKNAEGKELAEMYDMKNSGAAAFGDGINCIQSSGLLLKALQYIKAFNGTIIQLPDDKTISPHGLMNEGIVSTQLGLPGKPSMAEELIVARDIKLARYAGAQLHFTGVASAKSLEYIRKGKESNSGISCSVTPYHLCYSDEDLKDYDTNLKVNPPLRTKLDREALRAGILDGTIDCIASHHMPHEYDSKVVEFETAKHGMITLEAVYAVLNSCMPDVKQETWVNLLSLNPRRIFGRERINIARGSRAVLTLFDPAQEWQFTETDIRSRSKNSPFIGKKFRGKVIGIVNGQKTTTR